MSNRKLKIITTKAILLFCMSSLYAQEIETKNGILKGIFENEIEVYKGVPFAAAPVGELRWQAPKPPIPWDGVRLADKFSPVCMQVGMYPKDSPQEEMNEDCLYLNIWKPQKTNTESLPVMVWFYGGGLVNGSASTSLYSGENLTKKGVIVVTANYRLGALGFLAHPELSEEASYKSSGNYGLLDMIATLRWVQENIGSFGGDPNNVTILGQSSGAISINALTTSPLAKGLFHKVIAQSGGLFEPIELDKGFSLKELENSGVRFATRAGAKSLKELREIPANELIKIPAYTSINIDGYVLTQSPFVAYKNHEQYKTPVLLGYTTEEGRAFMSDLKITKDNYRDELGKHFPSWLVYLTAPDAGKTDHEALKAAISFQGDIRFGWNMWTWAKFASKQEDNKVYFYQFAQSPPYPTDYLEGSGSTHGSELFYVFGNFKSRDWFWTADDILLSNAMINYWTNFAKYGNPNSEELPQWPEFSIKSPKTLFLESKIISSPLITKITIAKIDSVYSVARFIMKYKLILIFLVLLMFSYLTFLLVKRVRNRRINT